MEPIKGGPCPGCVCCKSCGTKGFRKIVELKEIGLVVYKYTEKDTNMDKETELDQIVSNEDVFIVHNKNNMKMKNDDMRRAMDKYIPSCPRCKKIIEHVHNLIEKVPDIDKNNIIGICNQCKMKEINFKKQCECEKILKKFLLTNRDEKITLTNQMKEWLLKIQDKFKHITYDDDKQRFSINIQKDEMHKKNDYPEFLKDKNFSKFDNRPPQIELRVSDTHRPKSKDKASKSSRLLNDQLQIRYFSDEELLKIKKSILNYKELEAGESQTNIHNKKVFKSGEMRDNQAMRTYSAYEEFPHAEQSVKSSYDQEHRLGRRRSEERYTEKGLRQYLIDKAQKNYAEIDGPLYSNKKVTKSKLQNVKDTVSNIKYVSDEETPETNKHTKQLQKHDTLTPKSKEKILKSKEKNMKSIKAHSDSEFSQINDYGIYDEQTEKGTVNYLDTRKPPSKEKFKRDDKLRKKNHSDAELSLASLSMDYDKRTKRDNMRRLDTERSKQRIAGRKEVIEERRKIRSHDIDRIESRDKVGKLKDSEKKKKELSDEDIFRTMSKLTKHIDSGVGFSYYFPKEEKVVEKSVDVSSLELVKVTRDKIILKAKEEKEKKRVIEEKKKEERAKRLKEQEEKIRLKQIKEEEEAKKLKEEEKKIVKQKLKEEAKKQAAQEKIKLAQEKMIQDEEIKSKGQEIKSKDNEINSNKKEIQSKDQELQSKSSKRDDDRIGESKSLIKTEKSKQADHEKVGKQVKSTAEDEKSKPKEKKEKVGVDDTISKDKSKIEKTKYEIMKDKKDKSKVEETVNVKEKGEKIYNETTKKDKEKGEKIYDETTKKEKEGKVHDEPDKKEKGDKVYDEPTKKGNEKVEKVYDESTTKDKDKGEGETVKSKDEATKNKDEATKNKDEAAKNKDEATKNKDEAAKNKHEAAKNKDEATKNKDEATKYKEKSAKLKEEASTKQKELLDKERLEVEKFKAKEKEKSEKGKAEIAALANEKLKQMLAQQAKVKEEQEKKARELAEKKAREADEALKKERDVKPEEETAEQKELNERLKKKQIAKNLDITHIKVRKLSNDDDIFNLIQLKQKPTCLSDLNITNVQVLHHKGHKNRTLDNCVICKDSDIELDLESITRRVAKVGDSGDIVIGKQIFKYKHPFKKTTDEKDTQPKPMLFKTETTTTFSYDSDDEFEPSFTATKGTKILEPETGKGVIRYALSERAFIDKGWTMLPTEKVVRKMNVYRMRPAHPEFDWFAHNKHKRIMTYDTGEKLADFNPQGRGRWYYKNGCVALDYYNAEEMNAQQRFVIYSSGKPDERDRPRPVTVLATFDYLGNGVVFDHTGKIRLKYNQTEGVVLDRSLGPVSHWKWHTLNDPPVLQQVMIDTFLPHKDPGITNLGDPPSEKINPDNEEMLAIEFDNFVKEKSKKLSQKFKPFQIKMKALKINENFSLRVLDQATVYLIFREGPTNLKLNLGMILNHQEIIDTDTAEVGEVSNALERLPARTDSLAGLQRGVAYAQRVEHSRAERDRRLRRPEQSASVDRLKTGLSKPLKPPPLVYPSSATPFNNRLNCPCRKP